MVVSMNEYGLTINPRSKWSKSAKAAKVSVRELEILILHSEGKSNEEIAETLDIKYQTVKNMQHSLNRKLDATTNAQALMKAISEGLVKVNIMNKDERDFAEKIMWAIDTELSTSEGGAGLINMIKNWEKERKTKNEQGEDKG
jgi:DNA-binding CsgD family transcriptional regulator